MRFYDHLYVGESIKNPTRTKFKIRVCAGQFNVHLITLSQNGSNQLECFHNGLLKQKVFRRQDLYVIGIAANYGEAIDLIRRITEECVKATGTADIKSYLLNRST